MVRAVLDSGALLRLPVHGPTWTEQLPPVPRGQVVTVSLQSPDRMRDEVVLRDLGYRVVSARPASIFADAVADFVVASAVPSRHPRWWRALAAQAEKIYDLSCGPVQAAMADVVCLHAPVPGSGSPDDRFGPVE